MPSPENKNLPAGALAAIALTALVLISPTFFLGQISGNDFNFHLASWMEVVHQWHQGVLFPSWAAGAYNGFGEPRFIFYPPVSWLMGAFLGLVLPWKFVPDAFLFLTFVLAGASMHRLARRYMSQEAALATALIYMTAPYQLVDIYIRSPSAELLAAAILPLAVLCVLNCAPPDQFAPAQSVAQSFGSAAFPSPHSTRARCRNLAPLAIVYAAIWLTNAPMAVVTSYALAFLLIIVSVRRHSLTPLLTGGAGLAIGLLLASAYIVPATFEQRWVSIEEAVTGGLVFTDSIIFKWVSDPRHNFFNLMISTVASFEIIVSLAAAIILRKRTGKTGAVWIALVALSVLSAAVMLPFTGSLLQYLPKMRFIQFPWRWLIPLGISFSFFLGNAIVTSRRKLALILAHLVLIVAAATLLCKRLTWWDSTDVQETIAEIESGKGYEGTGEYGPRIDNPPDLPTDAPLVFLYPEGTHTLSNAPRNSVNGIIAIESWLDQYKQFTVGSHQPAIAAVHLLSFPAWRILVNGRAATTDTDPLTGQMLLPLPAGVSHVEIRFAWTPDRTVGLALSGVGILILSYIVIIGWRRSPAPAGEGH